MQDECVNLFKFEDCFSKNDPNLFLTSFKKVIDTGTEKKQTLTKHAGITIYTPQKAKNIKSKKNILLLIHELSRTGAPVVAVDAAKVLIKNGYFVTVVTMRRGPLLKELVENGIPVIFDRELAITYDTPKIIAAKNNHLSIDSFVNSFNQTIIVTAIYYNFLKRCSNYQKPIIWWLHEGTATYDNLGPLMPKQIKPPIKVYTGGKYALDQLKNYGLNYNAKVLNYGVTDTYTQDSNTVQTVAKEKVKFILPGSLGKRKGQKILLDAIKKLPKEYQKVSEFIFIGDILSEADIDGKNVKNQLLLASQNQDNIKYLPSVTRDELFKLYQEIDVLVLPSLDDPMPVVATEALMLEKIVLCSDTTGTSYYLENGKNGFIFKSENAEELCDKIKYIIDHKTKLPEIGRNGRKTYLKNFEMSIFEKNLLDIVKETK